MLVLEDSADSSIAATPVRGARAFGPGLPFRVRVRDPVAKPVSHLLASFKFGNDAIQLAPVRVVLLGTENRGKINARRATPAFERLQPGHAYFDILYPAAGW